MTAFRQGTPPGIGFDRFFSYPATRLADKVAAIDDAGEVSFAALNRRADRLAHGLVAAGGRAGDRVALILPNGIPFLVIEIAIMRAGMVKVPLNIRFHADEVMYALADCQPSLVLARPDYAERIAAQGQVIPSLKKVFAVGGTAPSCRSYEQVVETGDATPFAAVAYGDDDPILIRYTGGTTGRPKGIVHTHRSYIAIVLDVIRENALVEADIALQLGHLSHGLNYMWPAYAAVGATQVLREKFDPPAVWRDLARHRITWVYMVPTMIHMLLDADDGVADVSSLRTFNYASAPMPVPLLRRAIKRFGPIFTQVYTLSEAPVITTMLHPHEHVEEACEFGPRLGSIGREIATMELRLIDDVGRDVAPGEAGEIAVRSVNNMAYYWKRPEETAKTLVDGWLRTGDMARRARDGFLYMVDRKKDIIITGALNVWPKEVEAAIERHPAVAQVAVVGAPDEKWGERIVAYVVLRPGMTAGAEELIQLCLDHLADYKKPREVHFIDKMPTTPVGKVSRLALRQRARGAG
ncbi:MAG: AMP-binding protein [Alphaproteobacteria bacterium]|nr:AMP-binding protein [Alphaproteobacteria bacterium]